MFNAFNRTEFMTPNSDYNPSAQSTFGMITSDYSLPGSTSSARLCQAGLKFYF
jgi:hypothetical protein